MKNPDEQIERHQLARIEQLESDLKKRLREWEGIPADDYEAFRWLDLLTLEAADRIEQLEAERDELKADAMRYRWLRDNKAHNNTHCWHFQHGPVIPGLLTLDAGIDEAIAKGEKHAKA